MTQQFVRAAGLMTAVLTIVFAAPAQVSSPLSISGKVTDPQSNPVANIRVLLFDPQGASAGEAITDKNGQFAFIVELPGIYELKVNAPGFEQVNQSVEVEAGAPARADVHLGKLAEKQESITVTADVKDSSVLFPDPAP